MDRDVRCCGLDKCTAADPAWANVPLNIAPHGTLGSTGLRPLGSFTYSLTLYSECFSTFPHGTCLLSVSWWYLALEGVYLPLSAALSSNTTPWSRPSTVTWVSAVLRAYHPLWVDEPPSS